MGFFSKMAEWCLGNANQLVHFINSVSKLYLFVFSLLMIVFWLSGKRLSRFTKPGYAKLSKLIREIAFWLSATGVVMSTMLSICYLAIFMFVEFGFSLLEQFKNHSSFEILSHSLGVIWTATESSSIFVISGVVIGLVLSIYLNYMVVIEWERGEGLHNIDDFVAKFKTLKGFDPLPYINVEKGCFVGLDLNKKPIYIPFRKIRETHIQVLGATGTGKGVLMTLIAYQCIFAGESVIWFDPKFDRFSPRVLRMAAKLAGKKFHMINLNPAQPPQFNLLEGALAHEIEELLVAGFDLIGKGTEGDFHRGKDEDATILAAELAVKNGACSIPALIGLCLGVDEITKQENFWRKLRKLSGLSVIKTSSGLNLIDAIQKRQVIYIVGSTKNERVKMLQKMLLIRVMQIIQKQDRSQQTTPTCVVLDEFKHILSPTALTGLGVVRDFNSHFLLAHQSLGDLDSCAGITRAEAEGAVLDNTAIKFIYKLGDAGYAEKLSKISGKRSIFVEQVSKGIDDNSSESGGWRETHVPLIDVDVLTHLPMPSDRSNQPSTGVIFGVGKAKVFYVHHIAVSEDMPVPMVAIEYKGDAASDAGGLI